MSKKQELFTTKALVKSILENDEKARNCDTYLYTRVLDIVSIEKNISINVPVLAFLQNMSNWGFPPFETVRRSRQQLQHDFPELSANDAVKGFREENQAVFKDFARGAI